MSCKTDSGSVKEVTTSSESEIMADEGKNYNEIFSQSDLNPLLQKYTPFTLTTDISKLSVNEKSMIKKLIDAAKIMEECFWYEAYGVKAVSYTHLTLPTTPYV